MHNGTYNQLEKIKELDLDEGTNKRIDCIFCGHTKTLSITKRRGFLLWNCFSASCSAKGNTEEDLTVDDLSRIVSNTFDIEEKKEVFVLPEYFVEANRSKETMNYLEKYNCMEGYLQDKERFCYDIKRHRAVFTIVHEDEVVGAVGRSLNSYQKPKWYRYDNGLCPYMVGSGSTGVIVEDATSATTVAPFCTGIALLGTSLLDSYVGILKQFDTLIVALDPDAYSKSFDIQKTMSVYTNCRIAMIRDDLKYFSKEQAMNELGIGNRI